MYWHRDYLRENVTMTLGQTWEEDLPSEGLLGSILLRMSVSGVSGAFAETEKWRIVDFIDKIEVIGDGSDVIKSFTGEVASAVAYFDQGVANPDYWHSYATGTKWAHFLINFGRGLFDVGAGLNLARWGNVRLKITNSGSSTYFGAGINLAVLQYFLREPPGGAFAGYLRTEEWRKWTTVQNETKYLELPEEFPIRRVIMQLYPNLDSSNVAKTGMWNLADDIELNYDTGVTRIFKGGVDDLMWENFYHHGKEILATPNIYQTADYGRKVGIGYVLGAVGGAGTQDGAGASTVPTLEGRRTDFTQKPESYEADTLISTIVRGLCPEECIVIPFNEPDDPGAYLDPRARGTVQLNVHTRDSSSAADGTIRVVLDRFVR